MKRRHLNHRKAELVIGRKALNPPSVSRTGSGIVLVAFAVFSSLIIPVASATNVWLVESGNWNVAGNWNGGITPTTNDQATVDNNLAVLAPAGVSGTASNLIIGGATAGILNINGGGIADGVGFLGRGVGSNGTAIISSGVWNNSLSLYVGGAGAGTLDIVSGGYVTSGGSGVTTAVGWDRGSNGAINVSDGMLRVTGGLHVGSAGTGNVNINSGTVESITSFSWSLLYYEYYYVIVGYGYYGQPIYQLQSYPVYGSRRNNDGVINIGYASGAVGTVSISGGTLLSSDALVVGVDGTATLNLTGGSVIVNGFGALTIAQHANSVGTLNLGTGGAVGTLNATVVAAGDGTATVNFDHTGTYKFVPQLTGRLIVNKLGDGTTLLSNSNNYTGPTQIREGVLVVNGSLSRSSKVTIGNVNSPNVSAVLGGGGSVGSVTVGAVSGNTGAMLSPHAGSTSTSEGTTLTTGDLIFTDGAVHLALQLGRTMAFSAGGGNGALGGDVSDHVTVNGVLTLNGADLQLTLLTTTGYAIAHDDVLFLIINGGRSAVNGEFASLNGREATLSEGAVFWVGLQAYEITYTASFLDNSFSGGNDVAIMVVPELNSCAMMVGGLAVMVGIRQRRIRWI